jgi:hypothetical protein
MEIVRHKDRYNDLTYGDCNNFDANCESKKGLMQYRGELEEVDLTRIIRALK